MVLLRVTTPTELRTSVQAHLLVDALHTPGEDGTRVGPSLTVAESQAPSHCGSPIVRSRSRDGTMFELKLPRHAALALPAFPA